MSAEPRSLREPAPASPLLTVAELVEVLGSHGVLISASKARRLLDAGVIPSTRLGGADGRGGHYVVHRAEVLDWLQHGRLNRWRAEAAAPARVELDIGALVEVLADVVAAYRRRAR